MLVRMLLRRYVALAVVVTVFIAVPALAAPPAPEGGLSLAVPEGARADGAFVPSYGNRASFDSWVDGKLAKNYWLTIRVDCRQGNQGVYMNAGPADTAFLLEDQLHNGTWWDGGPAECTATLIYSTRSRATVVGYTHFSVDGTSG